MKKRISILALIFILGAMSISCFKKNENVSDEKDKETSEKVEEKNLSTGTASGDIFNLGMQSTEQQNNGIDNLTLEEQKILTENQIDPVKVSEAIKKAESGEKEAIMALSQLYYNLKDTAKVKKYLEIGVAKNYPEAIYNLAVIYKEEGKTAEANKLIAKLPKNTNVGLPAGAEEYNKAITFMKNKKYKEAKTQFEIAYNKGIKDVDIRIALLNKELKNISEALKWFRIANNRGVKGTNYEIGAILYDSGKLKESRPYLIKAYNEGEKSLAMPIAGTYQSENNDSEALKWFKIAAKNGNKDAKNIVAQIENGNKESNKSAVSTFLNSENNSGGNNSYINNTLAQAKNNQSHNNNNQNTKNNSDSGNDNNEKSTNTNKNGTVRTESHLPISKNNTKSTAREKDDYNVDIGDSGR